MSITRILRGIGDGAASVAFGVAESIAFVLSAAAMLVIIGVSQVVRASLASAEHHDLRRASRARVLAAT